MSDESIAEFERVDGLLDGSTWYLVVKSRDQLERRARMLATAAGSKIGRISPRETAVGLLVRGELTSGRFRVARQTEYREPRHIRRLPDGGLLLSEMHQVRMLDDSGETRRTYGSPRFAFLHTMDLKLDPRRSSGASHMLLVSSGYDAVFEVDLDSGETTSSWFAWHHGFNPDEDGCWLAADRETFERYRAENKPALFIDPAEYGEQGLVTARRTAHPNAAAYDPHAGEPSFVVCIAHDGSLHRVSLRTGACELVCNSLKQMPHGLQATRDGWAITDTTCGRLCYLDRGFRVTRSWSARELGGKVPGTEEREWIQQAVPAGRSRWLLLDANRALIAIDLERREYSCYQADETWCIQDALLIPRADSS